MATSGLYGSTSTGTVAPQSGSESVGLYGNNTVFGGSYFEYLIFLDSVSTPATPTGGSWSFVTNTGTPPTGWSNTPPQTPTGKVWISIALVNSKSTATLTWSTPGIFANPAGTGTVTSVAALTLTTAGTDVSSTVSNPTIAPVITLNLPTASATNRGALSAADWTTFNSKGSGTVTSVTGTAPVVSSGGTAPAISMPAATSSVSGYLTSTDWTTFNSKGSGSVTSVAATVPSFLSVSGSPITGSGTLAISYSGTALPVVNGGTGVTTSTGTGSVVLSTSPSLTTPTQVTYENWTPISEPSYTEGRVWYDSNAHALAYFNDAPNSVAHVGHELQVKVINNTGSSIPNGSPVYITSTSSGQTYPNIALARADVAATASVIGLTNGAIANGAFGYVVSTGTIDDVNTSTYTVGQVLYLSPYSAGQLMNTLPPTGLAVQVGVVEYVNSSTGKIYVKQTTPLSIPASILSGTVAIANGGTGQSTASAGFNALSPITTTGDLIIGNGTNSATRLAIGTNGYVLTSNGTTATWSASTGGVTSVTGTAPVVSSGGSTPAISLAASYGDTQNPYAAKTANYVLAAPNGSAGVPTFRAIVAADIPTLNQNTTGTAANITATTNSTLTTLSALSLPGSQVSGNISGNAANVTGIVAVANGGTGTSTPNLVAGTNVTITGTWPNQTIAASGGGGSGTVTSVAATVPSFLSVTGSPITTSGTLAISYSGTALPIANGGTGATTAQAAVNSLVGTVTNRYFLRGNGTNAVMAMIQSADVPTLNQDTTGTAANVTGTVAISNGGTGQTTASAAFNALSPITTTGDLILGNGTNSATRLPIGATGYVLTSNGTTASWAAGGGGSTITISNDTSTASNLYPAFFASTSGTASTVYTSNAKLLYKPSTGELQASELTASNGLVLNATTVSSSYTIGTGFNAMSVGPVTVASGQAVTVSSGQRWLVL